MPGDGRPPELVQVSEKNISQIENVHGYVSHSHISPMKVKYPGVLLAFWCISVLHVIYSVSMCILCKHAEMLCVIESPSCVMFTSAHIQNEHLIRGISGNKQVLNLV